MSNISRRDFLSKSGGLIVGFSLFGPGACNSDSGEKEPTQIDGAGIGKTSPAPGSVDSWIAIDATGQVTIFTGYIDVGTGIKTAIEQITADELEVPMDAVRSVNGDTEITPSVGISQASIGIATAARTTRIAAAAAREALTELGAKHLDLDVGSVIARAGKIVSATNEIRSVTYGDLIGGKRFDIDLSVEHTWNGPALSTSSRLKTASERTLIGKSVPRVDIPAKVFGNFEFVHNVRVPGMWHGRVVRPPSERQCTLLSVDEQSVSHILGAKVVHKGNFVGVVAPREEDAIKASVALQLRWEMNGAELPVHEQEKYAAVRNAEEIREENDTQIGDTGPAIAHAKYQFNETYEFAYQLHAVMGPSCAVADVREDGTATIWAGTQNPHGDRDSAARILGFDSKNVRLIWRQSSGGYGRFTFDDSVADAVLLSQLSGKPVRVQWMRQEENLWEPISPAMVFDLRAGIDENGIIVGLEHEQWSARHMLVTTGHLLAWRHSGEKPADGFAWGGGIPEVQYDIANLKMTRHVTQDIVRPMSLRTPGRVQSYFALESMIDEMAARLDEDPVTFRLRHLSNERSIEVISKVREMAAWKNRAAGPRSNGEGRYAQGRGIAYVEHYGGHLATIVRVVVDRQTGVVKVSKVWVAVDHGEIINPDGLLNQTEGGTLQGISRSLLEDVVYKDSIRTNVDWVTYPVMRYKDVPDIDIHLINRPEVAFVGAGEPSSAPVPAAIGNAIFDAIGVRLRRAPFLPERVKAALDS